MAAPLKSIAMPSKKEFIEDYIARNEPVVVSGLDYDADQWQPQALCNRIGDLTALVYGSLFELDDVQTLDDYIDIWFDSDEEPDSDTPYVRWYNKLRDVDFAWGDEAFSRVASAWRAPTCLPEKDFIVPVSKTGVGIDPVVDHFPYRGLLVAARGARTRMHRDPFCSDAVVCQFYGSKEAALYRPERAGELAKLKDDSSFGGFVDVRENSIDTLSVEPDYHGVLKPGEMIYIPHGWLHDVIAIEDSVSITWNFVHRFGSREFNQYLENGWQKDSEFEILQYFHRLAGDTKMSAEQIADLHFSAA